MSDPRCQIEIKVFLDGSLHCFRYWPAVPRIDELITLRSNGEYFEAKVVMVVWSETEGAMLAVQYPVVHLYANRVMLKSQQSTQKGSK